IEIRVGRKTCNARRVSQQYARKGLERHRPQIRHWILQRLGGRHETLYPIAPQVPTLDWGVSEYGIGDYALLRWVLARASKDPDASTRRHDGIVENTDPARDIAMRLNGNRRKAWAMAVEEEIAIQSETALPLKQRLARIVKEQVAIDGTIITFPRPLQRKITDQDIRPRRNLQRSSFGFDKAVAPYHRKMGFRRYSSKLPDVASVFNLKIVANRVDHVTIFEHGT
ncbi:MAG: hypothetical protein WBM97_17175, partial [Sedimenticolaceae bacterium]